MEGPPSCSDCPLDDPIVQRSKRLARRWTINPVEGGCDSFDCGHAIRDGWCSKARPIAAVGRNGEARKFLETGELVDQLSRLRPAAINHHNGIRCNGAARAVFTRKQEGSIGQIKDTRVPCFSRCSVVNQRGVGERVIDQSPGVRRLPSLLPVTNNQKMRGARNGGDERAGAMGNLLKATVASAIEVEFFTSGHGQRVSWGSE